MRNVGTQINELMKAQGYDATSYGRVSSRSTKNGLDMNLWSSTIDSKLVAVNRNEDGTYHIDTNPTHNNFAPCIVKDNIAEDVLFETFAAEMVSLAP
jgi:hypothetical protein|tara:strand:- start:170 stop:460 length:291 start_codon:yes stop_codon:yes gene_type:complete